MKRVKIVLNSGNYAVYDVHPKHLPHDKRIVWYGIHVATKFPSGWKTRLGHNRFEPSSAARAAEFDALEATACSCRDCGLVTT